MNFKMKPETIARRAEARKAEQTARRARLIADLSAKANAEGPDSIWAEMLAEQITR